jgi:hypothetical protein
MTWRASFVVDTRIFLMVCYEDDTKHFEPVAFFIDGVRCSAEDFDTQLEMETAQA